MAHWNFLEDMLGKDVVYYCIQPFLLPTKESVIKKQKETVRILSRAFDDLFDAMNGENVFETMAIHESFIASIRAFDHANADDVLWIQLTRMGIRCVNRDDVYDFWIRDRYKPITYRWIGDLIRTGKVRTHFRKIKGASPHMKLIENERHHDLVQKLFGNEEKSLPN